MVAASCASCALEVTVIWFDSSTAVIVRPSRKVDCRFCGSVWPATDRTVSEPATAACRVAHFVGSPREEAFDVVGS